MLMVIFVRDLKDDMVKQSGNGGLQSVVYSMTHKVLISDTKLRSFVPSQVSKMIPRLCQICRCELSILSKDLQVDLNEFRKIMNHINNRSLLGYTHTKVPIVLTVLYIPRQSFQLQMGFSFPFLHANVLHLSLLNMRTRSISISCTQAVHTQGKCTVSTKIFFACLKY